MAAAVKTVAKKRPHRSGAKVGVCGRESFPPHLRKSWTRDTVSATRIRISTCDFWATNRAPPPHPAHRLHRAGAGGGAAAAWRDAVQAGFVAHLIGRAATSPGLRESIRRNALADDANSAPTFAPNKGLPLGISDKVGATVTNRARADSLAHEVGRRLSGASASSVVANASENRILPIPSSPLVAPVLLLLACLLGTAVL